MVLSMTNVKIGERAGAILSAKNNVVEFLGYGVYVGDEIPTEACSDIADDLIALKLTNPKIQLDNGEIVYGCECWWGPEDDLKEKIKEWSDNNYTIREIKMSDIRKDLLAETLKNISDEPETEPPAEMPPGFIEALSEDKN